MIRVRGGSGLGDSLYVQAVARHLIGQGHRVEVCTRYPAVFRPLGDRVTVSAFRRTDIDRVAHYSTRRACATTDQFQDCCIQAGLDPTNVSLQLDWRPSNGVPAACLPRNVPVVIVKRPSPPFDRSDGYGLEFLPRIGVLQRVVDALKGLAFVVQIGKTEITNPNHRRNVALSLPAASLDHIDLDLTDRTTPAELIDVVASADAVLGFCSFLVPLAESLGKPGLFVWSRRGLRSGNPIIRQLTPRKVIHRPDLLRHVIDDCPESELNRAVDALLDSVGCSALV